MILVESIAVKKPFTLYCLSLNAELFKTMAFHTKQKTKPSLSEMGGKHNPQNTGHADHKAHENHPYLWYIETS